MRQRFKLRDQIQHRLRALANVLRHRLGRIEHEILRQITDDQIAPSRDVTEVRRLYPGEKFQKRRLAATIAPDQTDPVALVYGQRRGVEHRTLAVTDGYFSGSDDGGH